MAFLTAGGVKLIDKLKSPLGGYNQQAQGSLQDALGRIGTRQNASAKASGRVRGEYGQAELNRAGTRASGAIEDTLLGSLGGTSYDEVLKQKEHQRNLMLAKMIGDANAPSALEQVLSGLGGGARAGGQFYSLYNALGKGGGSYGGTSGRLPSNLSLIPGGSASQYYRGGF